MLLSCNFGNKINTASCFALNPLTRKKLHRTLATQTGNPIKEIPALLNAARLGEDTAAAEIHHEYVDKLVVLASRRINQRFRSKIAPEEIVQSVFASFFRRNQLGEFQCGDWNDLWALLVRITIHKCINKAKSFGTNKRDVGREVSGSVRNSADSNFFGWDREPSVQAVAIFNESLDELFDRLSEQMQQIVCLRLEGTSNFEISELLNCSERTVYRSLNRIRDIFREMENS